MGKGNSVSQRWNLSHLYKTTEHAALNELLPANGSVYPIFSKDAPATTLDLQGRLVEFDFPALKFRFTLGPFPPRAIPVDHSAARRSAYFSLTGSPSSSSSRTLQKIANNVSSGSPTHAGRPNSRFRREADDLPTAGNPAGKPSQRTGCTVRKICGHPPRTLSTGYAGDPFPPGGRFRPPPACACSSREGSAPPEQVVDDAAGAGHDLVVEPAAQVVR